jgi:hypothetical protein
MSAECCSDNCCGQNKNLSVNAMLHMKDRPEITSIEHEPGHTHMECDADHGKIEKKQKKNMNPISHPYDWRALVRSCGFTVLNMTCEHFLDFDACSKNSFMQKFRVVGTKVFVLWKDIRAIEYEHEFGVNSVKRFFTDEEYQKVDRSKKARRIAITDPPRLHSKQSRLLKIRG